MPGEQDLVPTNEFIEASQPHALPRARELAGFIANLAIDLARYLDSALVPWYTETSARPSAVAGARATWLPVTGSVEN